MKNISNEKRIIWLRKAIIFFFLIGIFLSFKLWVSDRAFPLLPVINILPLSEYPADYGVAFLLIILLCVNLFYWRNWINICVISILILLLIQDQNRWQPWAYIYFLFLILFSLNGQRKINPDFLSSLQILVTGIYMWSGIHKLNANFINETFESILTELFNLQDQQLISNLKPLGYSIPIVEIAIAILLYFPKYRDIGCYLVALTHIFILLYLSPLGVKNNSVVYPWNVAMVVIVFLLFFGSNQKQLAFSSNRNNLQRVSVIIFIYILPGLNFFGLWDNYLSFSLYSNKTNHYYIAVEQNQVGKLDKRLSQYFLEIDGLQGGIVIDVGRWSATELNVPFYPERRTFKKVASYFCKFGIKEDQLYFLELDPLQTGNYIRYECKDL